MAHNVPPAMLAAGDQATQMYSEMVDCATSAMLSIVVNNPEFGDTEAVSVAVTLMDKSWGDKMAKSDLMAMLAVATLRLARQ